METLDPKPIPSSEELDKRYFELLKHYNSLLVKVEMLLEEARKRKNK